MAKLRDKEVVAKKELFFLGYKVITLEAGGYIASKGSKKIKGRTISETYKTVLNEV